MINYQKIERYSLFTICVGMFVLFIFSLNYSLGFVLGGIASLIAFKWLQRLENAPMNDYKLLKRTLTKNKLIRYGIYAFALLISFLWQDIFNYIACFIGIMIVRFWLCVIGGNYDV